MKKSLLLVPVLVLALAGCSSPAVTAATDAPSAATTAAPVLSPSTWANPGSVSLTAIPLGDGHTSTSGAAVGTVFACQAGDPNAGGAQVAGPWIHGSTWNFDEKVVVQGSVSWPTASFTITTAADNRVIKTNDLPVKYDTGTFPIAASDPASKYDRNPNTINGSAFYLISLPVKPAASAKPNCLDGGEIGVLLNGVFLFDALDGPGRDAVAHEEQDLCQGHPQMQGQYHYHEVPTCLRDNAKGPSTVVGWANDGYPIVVERDAAGNLPNNADLDECHGRTSPVEIDGKVVTTYHYDATLEYPYTIGCYHGTNAVPQSGKP